MPALAQHLTRVTIDGATPIDLPVTDGTISMDSEWIPYVQASLTCPYDSRIADLDPQADDIWITVTVTRSTGRTDRIRDFSLRYAGQSLGAISLRFAGDTIAAITRTLYHDYEFQGMVRHDEVRTFRLMLREVKIDHAAATVSLKLASGEARASDAQHMGDDFRASGVDLAAKISSALSFRGFPAGLTTQPASTPTDAEIGDEAIRSRGQDLTEWIQQLTRKHDLVCWCDEDGLWHLAANRNRSTTRTITSLGPDRTVVNATETNSRDDGVNAVILRYTRDGVTQYDTAATDGFAARARIVDYTTPFPGTGRAARMLSNLIKRRRGLSVEAVSDPAFTPGEMVSVTTATGTRSGRLATVTWRLAADEMTLTLREVA